MKARLRETRGAKSVNNRQGMEAISYHAYFSALELEPLHLVRFLLATTH